MKEHKPPHQHQADAGISLSLREYLSRRDIAALYDGYFRGMRLFEFDTQVLDALFDEPGRLLDIGCGTGRHLLHFARRGFEVTGVDLSEHMIAIAREKLAAEGLTARIVRTNFCDLEELNDESFDHAICMFSTLGMVRQRCNRSKALAEVHRVLVPGGTFVMHAHNRMHNLWNPEGLRRLLKSYMGALVGRCEAGDLTINGYRGVPRMYLHSYTARELRGTISAAGPQMHKLLCLNESRGALIRSGPPAGLVANGFIAIARKPFNPV